MRNWSAETNPDVLAEAALAKAQHLMSHAITTSGSTEKQLAVRLKEASPTSIKDMLGSECDLAVQSLGRFLAVCGYRLRIEMDKLPAQTAGK